MRVVAYVHQGWLCLIGLAKSPMGPLPVAHRVPVEGAADGPCDFSGEVPAALQAAWDGAMPVMHERARKELTRAGAEELVRRERAGEQNAKATIIEVGKRYRAGDPAVRESYEALREVAAQPGRDTFGAEAAPIALLAAAQRDTTDPYRYPAAVAQLLRTDGERFAASAVLLAGGPPLDGARVKAIGAHYGPEEGLFAWGYKLAAEPDRARAFASGLSDSERAVMSAGRCVGKARAIQGIRREEPLAKLSTRVAWELGE